MTRHAPPRLARIVGLSPVLAACFAILLVRAGLGFQFPPPWPDETAFIPPAYDLATSGSMFEVGLDQHRVLMWMPPGHTLILALCFKLFGYSYALARWLSAACQLLALLAAVAIVRRQVADARRYLAYGIVGLAFLAPYTLIDANIARMDAMLGASIMLALLAGVSGRLYVMASLVAASAVIHFNAVYFVPAVLLSAVFDLITRRLRWPTAADWLAMVIAVLVLAAYSLYAGLHWRDFLHDMRFQFAVHARAAALDQARNGWMLWWAIALTVVRALSVRGIDASVRVAMFGAGFIAMSLHGHELWYDYGRPVGFSLIGVAWLSGAARRGAWLGALAAAGLTLVGGYRIDSQMRALMVHPAMLSGDFLPPAEIDRVRSFIRHLHPGATVNFGCTGIENYFLADLRAVKAHWIIFQNGVTDPLPLRPSDWNVVCDSPEIPPVLRQFEPGLSRVPGATGCRIFSGDSHRTP